MEYKQYYGIDEIMPSRDYMLRVNGEDVFVYNTTVGSFAVVESEEASVSVEVINCAINPIFRPVVRPLSLGIKPVMAEGVPLLQNRSVMFDMPVPARISVELDGRVEMPLFIFAYGKEEEIPAERLAGNVIRFAPGIHFMGEKELYDNDTLIIEKGAWVHGNVVIKGNNVLICGRGVLSGERMLMGSQSGAARHVITGTDCDGVEIRDITVVDGPTWHVKPVGFTNLRITGMNILGRVRSGDGIDLCGCSDAYVSGCFIRVHDDCICLKGRFDGKECVMRNIVAENCVLFNWEGGNGIEIGYETRCAEICDVVFRDIDIIHMMFEGLGSGGALTIHNGNRAHVHDVLYEDIRVEDVREKLIDIKMQTSTWDAHAMCGPVSDITFRGVRVIDGDFPVSIIRGYDFNNMIKGIHFEGLEILGSRVRNAQEARMVTELATEITFKEA